MPQCKSCGKKGIFLRLNENGLCPDCAAKVKKQVDLINQVHAACSGTFFFLPDCVITNIETTGLDPSCDHIIEICGIKIQDGLLSDAFCKLINLPDGEQLQQNTSYLTGIFAKEYNRDGISLAEAIKNYSDFVGDLPLVGHNINEFSYPFLGLAYKAIGQELTNSTYDTLKMARSILWGHDGYSLMDLQLDFDIESPKNVANRCLKNCETTLNLFNFLMNYAATDMIKFHSKGRPIFKNNEDEPRLFTYYSPAGGATNLQKQLIENGCLEEADLEFTLNYYTLPVLKQILASNNLPSSGTKQNIISRIMENIPEESISIDPIYIPSKIGLDHVKYNSEYGHYAYLSSDR